MIYQIKVPAILIFAVLDMEIWRVLGSDSQVNFFASTVTSQLPAKYIFTEKSEKLTWKWGN